MHAVIMAGGRGTRFWPRSREKKPKHLLDIISNRTIIQETVDRILPLIKPENILVVTGRKHARILANQLPEIPSANIIIEPEGRNTAPCIGLAALHIRKKAGDDVMVVLPSDHAVTDTGKFLQVIKTAVRAAEKAEALVTVGIKPTSPQTGFGYIERGDSITAGKTEDVFRVKSIREKPGFEQAAEFVQSGRFYWNSGMFIWKVSTILKSISRWLPDLAAGLTAINETLGLPAEKATVAGFIKSLSPFPSIMGSWKRQIM